MTLHLVLRSKEELSTLKDLIPGALSGIEYEDSYMYVKLHYTNTKEPKWSMAYVVTRAPTSMLMSLDELQQWLLLVSMSWSPEEALTQITGGT